ncbi:hypothetical protein ACGFNU_11815 [Spirillospora sp. NPDC048911]|uniref:hypothetical protein n=1 Tax=Spirillospora sp. NPDC048911 TaxID=3364527 RepID=UPI003719F603
MTNRPIAAFSAVAAITVALGTVVAVSAQENEALDAALAAGVGVRKPAKPSDFNGRAELVVGTPFENGYKVAGTSRYVWPGRLYVFTGTRAGLTVKGVRNLGPADIGVNRHNALLADPLLP